MLQVIIRKGKNGPEVAEVRRNVLKCTLMKAFWIIWTEKRLRVGSGVNIGANELVFVDVQWIFNSISLAFDNSVSGKWRFNTQQGTGMNV